MSRQANAQKVYEVSAKDLPVSCPQADMPKWNSHPRVFLPLDDVSEAVCPYCSANYILKED